MGSGGQEVLQSPFYKVMVPVIISDVFKKPLTRRMLV